MRTFLKALIVFLNFLYGYLLKSYLLYSVGALFGILFLILAVRKSTTEWDNVIFKLVIVFMTFAYGFMFSSFLLYIIGSGFAIFFIAIAIRNRSTNRNKNSISSPDRTMTMDEIANAREKREQENWDAERRSSKVTIGASSEPGWTERWEDGR
jgi:uncharacterized membrane protein YgaE (UPF0421/DUF939 family)